MRRTSAVPLVAAALMIVAASPAWAIECTTFVYNTVSPVYDLTTIFPKGNYPDAGQWIDRTRAAVANHTLPPQAISTQPGQYYIMVFAAVPNHMPLGHVALVTNPSVNPSTLPKLPSLEAALNIKTPPSGAISIANANFPTGHAMDIIYVASNDRWQNASLQRPPTATDNNHNNYVWTVPEKVAGFINTSVFPPAKKK